MDGADREVVLLFALFHDSMRLNDGHDPEHGKRGSALARELAGLLPLGPGQLELLTAAATATPMGSSRRPRSALLGRRPA